MPVTTAESRYQNEDAWSKTRLLSIDVCYSIEYGYGTIATFIVSILGLLGIVILPCFNKSFYNQMLIVLTGLAVGTLFCDVVLHIIPEVLEVEVAESDTISVPNYVIKLCIVILTLYIFWLFEVVLGRITGGNLHSHSHFGIETSGHSGNSQQHTLEHAFSNTADSNNIFHLNQINNFNTQENKPLSIESTRNDTSISSFTLKRIKPTAWMLILGDTMHNLCDGLAIGASFSQSLSLGVSTTVAVVCHEIPHEIADYAVYVQCGFKHWQALLINFSTTITCFIGFYIGASISTDEDTTRWILAITAGMFLYIALVDLMPALIESDPKKWSWVGFIAVNIAMWIGFIIMFLLVIFESKIKI